MVVAHRHAHAAEAAVFGARGFGARAGRARVVWVEECVVEGVVLTPSSVVAGGDVVRAGGGADVGEGEGLG